MLKLPAVVVGVLSLAFVGISVLIGMPPFGYIVRAQRAGTSSASKLTNMRLLTVIFAATLGTMVVIQAIPYGRSHSNPPITGEPQWATPRTRELMVRACFGCHSNEVEYPSYVSVAPISWVVAAHVSEGRKKVNYLEFDSRQRGADETVEVIEETTCWPSCHTWPIGGLNINLHCGRLGDTLGGMCKQTTCKKCGKADWAGCGAHVEQVLEGIPHSERCHCSDSEKSSTASSSKFFSKLFKK